MASADIATASELVRRIEDITAARQRRTVAQVRPALARKASMTPSKFRHIREGRSKIVAAWAMDSLRALLVETLNGEVQALTHEIAIARQIGEDPRGDVFREAEAALAHARALLRGTISGG